MYSVRNEAPWRVSGKKLICRVPASASRTAPSILLGQQVPLVDHDAAGAAVAGADELGDVAGHLLAPVPGAARGPVAVLAAVHDPDHPAAAVAVVVVVAGEDVAERVQAGLVVVALAVGEDLELGAVAVDAEGVGELVATRRAGRSCR